MVSNAFFFFFKVTFSCSKRTAGKKRREKRRDKLKPNQVSKKHHLSVILASKLVISIKYLSNLHLSSAQVITGSDHSLPLRNPRVRSTSFRKTPKYLSCLLLANLLGSISKHSFRAMQTVVYQGIGENCTTHKTQLGTDREKN